MKPWKSINFVDKRSQKDRRQAEHGSPVGGDRRQSDRRFLSAVPTMVQRLINKEPAFSMKSACQSPMAEF